MSLYKYTKLDLLFYLWKTTKQQVLMVSQLNSIKSFSVTLKKIPILIMHKNVSKLYSIRFWGKHFKNIKVKEDYWINSPTNNGIKATRYTKNNFLDTERLLRLSYDKPHLNLGINRIILIRAGYEKNIRISIASNRVTDNCLRYCSCCGICNQSFQNSRIL